MALPPNAVSSDQELVESFIDRVYHPHKGKIWAGVTLFFVAVIAVLAVREYQASRRDDMWSRYREAAGGFELSPVSEPDKAAAAKQVETLQQLVKDYPDDSVTPFALLQMAKAQFAAGEYEAALKTIETLRSSFKDFPLNRLPAELNPTGRAEPLVQKLEDAFKSEREWSKKQAYVHHWPSEDRLALVETSAGSMWLGFYSDPSEAPQHVAAFVERAKRGDYNGTQVYSIIQTSEGAPSQFECGSKASGLADRGGVRDPAEQDKDEPTDTIESEESRAIIHHEYRVVSSAKMDSGESATRFLVVAKRGGLNKLNGESTPFAAVMEREKSLETLDKIGRSPTYGNHAETKESPGVYRMRDHPYPAIYIRRVSIFSKEKLEDGHTWDTTRVGKSEPEPWEASLTSPKPDEFADRK
jgi:cyclophilin family peptidyl-prolyl cis-trans isomerase